MFHFSTYRPSLFKHLFHPCQQVAEQTTMMAAVRAADKQLIASWYLMQISAHFAFSYTKHELFAS